MEVNAYRPGEAETPRELGAFHLASSAFVAGVLRGESPLVSVDSVRAPKNSGRTPSEGIARRGAKRIPPSSTVSRYGRPH